ncbi:MAG: phosphatase PAP2 family protein [Xanthobacteraceae bacterium]
MKAPIDDAASVKLPGPLAAALRFTASLVPNFARNFALWGGVLLRPPRAKTPHPPAGAFVAIVLTLGAVVALMFLTDAASTDWARHLPHWFTDAFEQITNAGLSGWFLIPSGVIVLCLAALASPSLPRMTRGVLGTLAARFGFLFIAVALPSLFDTTIKRLIGRARPYADIPGDPFTYRPFTWRSEFASLPSGHATTAAAAAFAIGAMWPRTRWVMWLYALVIMFSRVVVLSHHPSDVVAGALVGTVGAALVRRWFAARRLVFSGNLSTYRGPSLRRIGAAIIRAVCGPWGNSRSP